GSRPTPRQRREPTSATPTTATSAAGRSGGPPNTAASDGSAGSGWLRECPYRLGWSLEAGGWRNATLLPFLQPQAASLEPLLCRFGRLVQPRETFRLFLFHQVQECLLGLLADAADADQRHLVLVEHMEHMGENGRVRRLFVKAQVKTPLTQLRGLHV